jgi:hypothetical protein
MGDWTIWASFLALGTAAGMLGLFILCRTRFEQTQSRIAVLEREVAMASMREEANQDRLIKIFEAVTELRNSTEGHLLRLKERLDELRAEGYPRENVDAA